MATRQFSMSNATEERACIAQPYRMFSTGDVFQNQTPIHDGRGHHPAIH
jgi:hypothetical protein